MISFFIPNGVIAELGLTNDGETVSKQVRLGDLVADGTFSANEYHDLASAGVVFVTTPQYVFQSVEETAEGWLCGFNSLSHLAYLSVIFPGGVLQPLENANQLQLWLPEPPPKGYFFRAMLVRTQHVLRERGYCSFPNGRRIYSFSEGTVALEPEDISSASEWVEMWLYRELLDPHCRSYLAQGGRYELSLDYLKRDYQ